MPGYRLSRRAEADLRAIYRYTERRFGRIRAVRYVEALRKRLELIGENPAIGRPRPEIDESARSIPSQSHVIYYQPGTPAFILRILHGAQDPERHLPE